MNRLERTRIRSKLHKAEVARRANISRSHYGRIEAAEDRASFEVATRIAAVFDNKISPLHIIAIGPVPDRTRKKAA
jgi:DNA-binding XRE family transcriptional regulator